MSNEVKTAYETQNVRPVVQPTEKLHIPFVGALSVGSNRTLFLAKAVIRKDGSQQPLLFSQETHEKIRAILEVEAAAQGGILEYKPETPIMHATTVTSTGRKISTSWFINNIVGFAERCGLKMVDRNRPSTETQEQPQDGQNTTEKVQF